jgi:ribokinase
MRAPADIVVIGDALLDVEVVPDAAPRSGADVPAAVRVGPGGQGANLAVRLARLGVRVRLACALGDDASGRLVRESLAAQGIELDDTDAVGTGAVVILVGSDGERTMLSRRVPLLPRTLGSAPWTVISGYALLEAGDLRVGNGRRAVVGCAVPDGDEGVWWLRADELRPDLVVLNGDEARALGADAPTLAAESGAVVVVTEPGGAVAALANGAVQRAVIERVSAVDTTGAGDAFAAALLAELHDRPWPPGATELGAALAAAMELAAQVAGVHGAQAAVPLESGAAPA